MPTRACTSARRRSRLLLSGSTTTQGRRSAAAAKRTFLYPRTGFGAISEALIVDWQHEGQPEAFDETLKMFTLLMGKGEASGRRAWMEEKGDSVEADV